MAVVPPLSFANLHQPANVATPLTFSTLQHHHAAYPGDFTTALGYSDMDHDAAENSCLGVPGTGSGPRASARTRARAKLRAQARQRRREGPDSARETPGSSTARTMTSSRIVQHTICEADESEASSETGDHNPITATSRTKSSSEPMYTARETARGSTATYQRPRSVGSDSDIAASEAGSSLLRFGPCVPWEAPLTLQEKKERLLLLFDKEKHMAIRHAREKNKTAQAQLDALHEDTVRLKRERGDLRELLQKSNAEKQSKNELIQRSATEMQVLRMENKRYKDVVSELQLRLQLMEREREEMHHMQYYQVELPTCQVMPEVNCQPIPNTCRGYVPMPVYCMQPNM